MSKLITTLTLIAFLFTGFLRPGISHAHGEIAGLPMGNGAPPMTFADFAGALPRETGGLITGVVAARIIESLWERDPLLLSELSQTALVMVPVTPIVMTALHWVGGPTTSAFEAVLKRLGAPQASASFAAAGMTTVGAALAIDLLVMIALERGKPAFSAEHRDKLLVTFAGSAGGYAAMYVSTEYLPPLLATLGWNPPALAVTAAGVLGFSAAYGGFRAVLEPRLALNRATADIQQARARLHEELRARRFDGQDSPALDAFNQRLRELLEAYSRARNAIAHRNVELERRYLSDTAQAIEESARSIEFAQDTLERLGRIPQERRPNAMFADPADVMYRLRRRIEENVGNHARLRAEAYVKLRNDPRFEQAFASELRDLLDILGYFESPDISRLMARTRQLAAARQSQDTAEELRRSFSTLENRALYQGKPLPFAKLVQAISACQALVASELSWHAQGKLFSNITDESFRLVRERLPAPK